MTRLERQHLENMDLLRWDADGRVAEVLRRAARHERILSAKVDEQARTPPRYPKRALGETRAAVTAEDDRPLFVLGVTTWNRRQYIQRFIESFESTRSHDFRWALVVADDGSTDGTLDYLKSLEISDCQLVIIENKRATVAGQTNTILLAAQGVGFDFGIKCDDDVFFLSQGWDRLYYDAALKSGLPHLVYHNTEWKPAVHENRRDGLVSRVSARESMGCFWTFSREVIDVVGYFDEINFPFRGHAHIDFTVRCCRAGYNNEAELWDAEGSNEFVGMWQRDDYIELVDWNSPQVKAILTDEERARRAAVINSARQHVPLRTDRVSDSRARLQLRPAATEILASLAALPRFRVTDGPTRFVDAVFVLNLYQDLSKWSKTASELARHGMEFERYPAVFGYDAPHVDDWRRYAEQGLNLPIERRINRKLIQSPGAWGYLLTMRSLIREAMERRLKRIVVFDDDVLLKRNFSIAYEELFNELPRDWKLVYLGCAQLDWGKATEFSGNLYHPGDGATGSFAVMLDHSVFEPILDSIEEFTWPFDSGPLHEIARQFPRQTFAAKTPLAIADVSSSAIRSPRPMDEFCREVNWNSSDYSTVGDVATHNAAADEAAQPLISVLLVAENDEDTLADALRSLRTQTYPEIEILVLDNASRDRTSSVLEWQKQADPRIRAFNVGERLEGHTCLNLLLRSARGRYVTLHGAAEISARHRIQSQVDRLLESGAVAVEGPVIEVESPPPGGADNFDLVLIWARAQPNARRHQQISRGLLDRRIFETVGDVQYAGENGFREAVARLKAARARDGLGPIRVQSSASEEVSVGVFGPSAPLTEWRSSYEEVLIGHRSAFFNGSLGGIKLTCEVVPAPPARTQW